MKEEQLISYCLRAQSSRVCAKYSMADDTVLAEATRPLSFALFLEMMKEPAAQDLVRGIKECEPVSGLSLAKP